MNRIFWLLALLMLTHTSAWAACDANIQATTPDERFIIDAANGLVTDKVTGLVWQRCSLGQTGSNCSGASSTYTWETALQAAEDSNFAGYNDWRLPNAKELASIVERKCTIPAINTTVFPATVPSGYRSSSPDAGNDGKAWCVDFYRGNDYNASKNLSYYVRLVRGGQ